LNHDHHNKQHLKIYYTILLPDLSIRVMGKAGRERVGKKIGSIPLGWSGAPARLGPCGDANTFSFIIS